MKFRISALLAFVAAIAVSVAWGNVSIGAALCETVVASALLTSPTLNFTTLFACPSPFDALRIATENLPDDIYRKASWFSIWMSYVKRGVFPKNTGVNQTTFVIGNSEPSSNVEGWTDMALTDNVISTVCTSSYTDVDVGFNEVTYKPRRFGLAGPVICKETLSFAHKPQQFISQYMREMAKRSKRSWDLEFRNTYMGLGNKLVCRPGQDITNAATFPQVAASSQLTWDILDVVAQNLIQNGATDADQDMIELGPDGPVFPLIIGLDAKQKLFTNVQAKRDDVHFAQEGMNDMNLLFRRLGATDTHKNFRLVPDVLPPRFNFTNGVGYTQVNTWEMVAGSEGSVARITAAYKNALYEGAIQLHPDVFHAEMVAPDGAGLDWLPTNYSGEWLWKTGGKEITNGSDCFDPLHKFGRHFAEMMYAPNPIFPEFGTTIIFKRCPGDTTYAGCVS